MGLDLKKLRLPASVERLSTADFRSLPAKKMNKYGAKCVVIDGVRFDSTLEAKRWLDLELLARLGKIQNLRRQIPYRLEVFGQLISTYRADFVYEENGTEIVEDAKGKRTPEYKMKAKLMLAIHQIEIREFTAQPKPLKRVVRHV